MAKLTRFTVDLVTDEELSDSRIAAIARDMTSTLHILGVEDEDGAHSEVDKFAYGHTHDTAEGDRCGHCVEESLDYKNGDTVLNA